MRCLVLSSSTSWFKCIYRSPRNLLKYADSDSVGVGWDRMEILHPNKLPGNANAADPQSILLAART